MAKYEKVFSDYEILKTSIKFEDMEQAVRIGCVGQATEELAVRVVTKNCEGIQVKSVATGATSGTLSLTLHMRHDLYVRAFGMDLDGLKSGVYAYGKNSRHEEFCLVAEIHDEDGNKKLVAYPRCVMASAPNSSPVNGAEEVAEIEIELNLFADDDGNVKYVAILEELDEDLTDAWFTNFNAELVKASEENPEEV